MARGTQPAQAAQLTPCTVTQAAGTVTGKSSSFTGNYLNLKFLTVTRRSTRNRHREEEASFIPKRPAVWTPIGRSSGMPDVEPWNLTPEIGLPQADAACKFSASDSDSNYPFAPLLQLASA